MVLLLWTLATTPVSAASTTPSEPDWVSLRPTESSETISIPFTATAHFKAGEPRSIGFVLAGEFGVDGHSYRFGFFYRGGGGVGTTVRTAGPSYTVTATRSGPETLRLTGWTLRGTREGLLVFSPGGRLSVEVDLPSTVGIGRRQGRGAHLLRIGEGAAGVGGAGVAAGAAIIKAKVQTGVVGTLGSQCAACYSDWTPPGGQLHQSLDFVLTNGNSFAGQAGSWSWRWLGLGLGFGPDNGPFISPSDPVAPDGIIGAYAPVPDWETYRVSGD
ncbi:MAG: hypothetical protein NVS1B12_05260 [Acidimicrobiales bacterium]